MILKKHFALTEAFTCKHKTHVSLSAMITCLNDSMTCQKCIDCIVLLATLKRREWINAVIDNIEKRFAYEPVFLITDHEETDSLVELMRNGVIDIFILPFREIELVSRIRRHILPKTVNEQLAARLKERLGLKMLIGESPSFQSVINKIPLMAKSDVTVLIEGETGTGKELCARTIHYLSPRTTKPFIPVNCGAIPVELVENELFGHICEAFTGATHTKQGLIEAAESGTLFLDEIDSLPPYAQIKLLRLLQDKEYRPLGSSRYKVADIRLIVATNANIEKSIQQGRIRSDFYYRINILNIKLPALRERTGDVLILSQHFLLKYARQLKKPPLFLSSGAIKKLVQHHWPGNIRELEHVIERAVILTEGRTIIDESVIQIPLSNKNEPISFKKAKAITIANFERSYIENLLSVYKGNITQAAIVAEKNRRAFWELIRKYKIDPNHFRRTAVS